MKMTGYGMGISEEHARLLADSGISPEVAAARQYRSADTKSHLKSLGFKSSQQRVPGLLLPVWSAVRHEIANWQLRSDLPRVDARGRAIKYETVADRSMVLDAHPHIWDQVGDPSVPLFITEGIRKADAAISAGVCCVALLGVWNWRGRNEQNGKTALPDWEAVALNGRDVYVVFDSDVMTKPEVHQALTRLRAFLEAKQAHVQVIYLPADDGQSKVGLDDFLMAGNTVDDLLALACSEIRPIEATAASTLPYRSSSEGIVWEKPMADGVVAVPLTNFDARIVTDVCLDDGVEQRRHYEMHCTTGERETTFSIPAEQFDGLRWASAHLGARGVVYPGFSVRDHARAAIQFLSHDVVEHHAYAHLGWRNLDGKWVYLHAGGAIGADGRVDGIDVEVTGTLNNYVLPDPVDGDELRASIRAFLGLLDLAPDQITVPLFGAVWRVVLGPVDASIGLFGRSGVFKSELAALAQQCFGAGMARLNLPASWSATANALEELAFGAKDAVLVVDDYAPFGSAADTARLRDAVARLLRAQGNTSGRSRMRADGSLRPTRPPRGMVVMTGEDVPSGGSIVARMLVVHVGPHDVHVDALTKAQGLAADGVYSRTMASYLAYLAPQYDNLRSDLGKALTVFRDKATASHRRTPDLVGNLMLGWSFFMEYALCEGAVDQAEHDEVLERVWTALGRQAAMQAREQDGADPTHRFLDLLRSALSTGRAHVCAPDGGAPESPRHWGWRHDGDWVPLGTKVGWVDGNDLYLDINTALAAAQRLGQDGGHPLSISTMVLPRRLNERGLLVSREMARGTFKVRRVLEQQRQKVIHLSVQSLWPSSDDQPDQPDHGPSDEMDDASDGAEGMPPSEHAWEPGSRPSPGRNPLVSAAQQPVGESANGSTPTGDGDAVLWSGRGAQTDQDGVEPDHQPDHESVEPGLRAVMASGAVASAGGGSSWEVPQ